MKIKNTSIRYRKNGLYELRYYQNKKQKSIYAKTQNKLRQKYNARIKKQVEYKKTITLKEWYEIWLNKFKKPLLKPKSIQQILNSFKNYILEKLGNKELNKINEKDIETILNQIKNKERTKTLVYIHIKDCLNKAIPKYITENPTNNIIIKKFNGNKGRALTREEQNILFEYIEKTNNKYKNLFKFYLLTGTRLNEAINIKLENINFENKSIHIKGTKTKNSNRIIPVNDNVLELIPKIDKPFFYNQRNVQKEFKDICKSLNINGITIHSLRHTFVTRCIEKGIKLTTIQKWVGHSSIKITSDIYGEIQGEFEREELNKLK